MNKRLTQLFALMAASLVWNLSTASPAQLPQYMAPAYAPASSSIGIASFRPNYRFHPQPARQHAPAPTRKSGWSYQPYPGVGVRSWPFPVSYQPVVTPWQGDHYYRTLAGGYRPYQPAMPMPWLANPGPRMGQWSVPAYPAMPLQPMRYRYLAGLPWGNAPVASNYPAYYRAPAPREAQNPFQRPDRRYIRGQFAANNPRFRPAQQPQRYTPVASSYPAYYRASAQREALNPFQRPDRRYIRGQFAANNPRFRQVQQPQRHVSPASYNGPRGMAYRFRPAAPSSFMPLNSAPVAVKPWQPRAPYANPVVQWQKSSPYRSPAHQFRPDPRLVQAPQSVLPGASKNGRPLIYSGYGRSFQQTVKGVVDGLVWRPLRGDSLAGDMQNGKASYQ